MRSQHFGFIVQTQILSEAEMFCSLPQAYELTKQLLKQMDGISFEPVNPFIHKVSYTACVEAWLKETNPEVELVLRQALVEYGHANEMKRMLVLKEALSWRWPKFRDEATIAQIYLSLTMDKTVHVLMLIGWNEQASEKDIDFSHTFAELFYANVSVHGIKVKLRMFDSPEPETPKSRPYGQRLDTAVKLTKLYENREKERSRGKIEITRQQACDLVGIALTTVKKYDPILYDRWYDAEYEAST
jgi:hypothetical protein